MTLGKSVMPAALALAGCFSSESEPPPEVEQVTYHTPGDQSACAVEDVVHHLRGEVVQAGAAEKSLVRRPSSLVVTVAESSSVVTCGEDLVRMATPGVELASATFGDPFAGIDLEVPATIIGGQRPAIWVRALIDDNDNGTCDEGELVGATELRESELGDFTIELHRDGCPSRT